MENITNSQRIFKVTVTKNEELHTFFKKGINPDHRNISKLCDWGQPLFAVSRECNQEIRFALDFLKNAALSHIENVKTIYRTFFY